MLNSATLFQNIFFSGVLFGIQAFEKRQGEGRSPSCLNSLFGKEVVGESPFLSYEAERGEGGRHSSLSRYFEVRLLKCGMVRRNRKRRRVLYSSQERTANFRGEERTTCRGLLELFSHLPF
jgi:hypothetical protein